MANTATVQGIIPPTQVKPKSRSPKLQAINALQKMVYALSILVKHKVPVQRLSLLISNYHPLTK